MHKGHVLEYGFNLICRTQKRKTATNRKDRGRGKKGGAILQAGHDLRVDHFQVTAQRIVDPFAAALSHRLVEAEPRKTRLA
ncbi:hypothetical protein D3C86_2011170 [compost metagenome]